MGIKINFKTRKKAKQEVFNRENGIETKTHEIICYAAPVRDSWG